MLETNMIQQQKKEFHLTMSMIFHEIRNPVSLISSELQFMASQHPEIVSYECWNDIIGNLEYIIDLLNELSAYNNSENLTLTQTDLSTYLTKIAASVKPTCDYLGIDLKTNIADHLPQLPLDRIKMRQALLNLLKNAQEAISAPDGIIHFSAQPHENGLCITIRDNGCGMTEDQRQHIFTPFVTYKPKGTGLGLAITKQIITAHNGTLEVYSTSDSGTEFRIFLG